jgi:hypothetical protein
MLRTRWFWVAVWTVWVGWFAVWETIALRNPPSGDTLSEQIWWVRDHLSPNVWSLLFLLFVAVMVWVVLHFGWQR